MNKKNQNVVKYSLPYIILFGVIMAAIFFYNSTQYVVHDITTGELKTAIREEKVTEMTITPKSSESIYYITGKLSSYANGESFNAKMIGEDIDVVTEYANQHNLNLKQSEHHLSNYHIRFYMHHLGRNKKLLWNHQVALHINAI